MGVKTIGRWTGLARGNGGTGFQSVIPFYDQFSLGGLFRLSGRPQDQLTGPNYGLVALLLYYRLSKPGGLVLKNFSIGVSAEAGNTWAYKEPVTFGSLKTAGSIYVIADTLLGPLFIGYGRSGSNNGSST